MLTLINKKCLNSTFPLNLGGKESKLIIAQSLNLQRKHTKSTNWYMKVYWTTLVFKEMQIKPLWDFISHQLPWLLL